MEGNDPTLKYHCLTKFGIIGAILLPSDRRPQNHFRLRIGMRFQLAVRHTANLWQQVRGLNLLLGPEVTVEAVVCGVDQVSA